MRSADFKLHWAAWAAALALVLSGGNVLAQQAPAPAPTTAPAEGPEQDEKLADLWSNFVHYILLARPDVAQSYGKAILDANPDPRQVYYLAVQTDRSGATLARGRGIKQLAPTVDGIVALIEKGAMAVRMDTVEIGRWIKMLGGTPRQMLMATERLVNSGQYAVPQLIAALEDPDTSDELKVRITNVLPRLGKDAVRPLCEALQSADPSVRELVARTLGKIGYRHAGPYLKELAGRQGVLGRTRRAAEAALIVCAGRSALTKPVAELYYELAEAYYKRDESVNPDSRYDVANVWYWQEGLGLSHKVVPRVIFNEVYAMRAARTALKHDSTFEPAIPLWIAADLRLEALLPAGATNPVRPADQPGAAYYAKAAGAKYLQAVLKRGLDEADLAVAAGAIAALQSTTGAKNLVATMDRQGGAQPLVAALNAPARPVRYLAAETLALARPDRRFTGWHLVVPVLTEALRQMGKPAAVLADPDLDRRNQIKDLLRAAGAEVFDADALGPALQAARDAGGVDLCVIASNVAGPGFREAVIRLRSEEVLSRVFIVVVARPVETIAARGMAKADPGLMALPEAKVDAAAIGDVMKKLAEEPAGVTPLTAAQGAEWAVRAAKALGMLAATRNPVYDLTSAVKPLIAALGDQRPAVRIAAAEALAQIGPAEAQRAVADLADDAAAGEEVRLAAYAALSASVRLFGNQLTEKQVKAVVDMVAAKGELKIREAAAQVLGALNLPSEKIKELIVKPG